MSFFRNNKNKNKVIYNIINISENTKDKECIDADNKNEKKYRETITKVNKETKKWENTGVNLTLDIIPPPVPNNYDRLIDFRKKNVLRPAILQSEATIYLYKKNYVLGKDYDAYQAIDVANKLIKYEKQTVIDEEEVFQNDLFNDENVNLDILNLNPNIERKRVRSKSLILPENTAILLQENLKNNKNKTKNRSRSKSLSGNKKNKLINKDIKPNRSLSLDNNKDNNNNIDEIIDEFDFKSKVNNTQKEDLFPNIQSHIVFPVPSAPSVHSVSSVSSRPMPSAPPRSDDDYYPRKNSLDDSYMC